MNEWELNWITFLLAQCSTTALKYFQPYAAADEMLFTVNTTNSSIYIHIVFVDINYKVRKSPFSCDVFL